MVCNWLPNDIACHATRASSARHAREIITALDERCASLEEPTSNSLDGWDALRRFLSASRPLPLPPRKVA